MPNYFSSAFGFISSFSFLGWTNDIEYENGILVLTSSNFKEALYQHEYLMVEYFVRRCPHCKTFGPEYQKLRRMLNDQNSKVKLAQVDGQVEKALIWKNNIMAYPTIRLYRNGKPVDYLGEKKAEDIVKWLNRNCPKHC